MNKFKTFTVLLGVLLMASMTSCKKDGVYTPSKKIQKVYKSSTYLPKHLTQVWNWNDDLLNSIEHYTIIGIVSGTEKFTYNDKRLVRIDDHDGAEYTIYSYEGNRLKSVDYYYHDILRATAAYEHSGGKVSKATLTYYHGFKKNGDSHLMSSFLPFADEIAEVTDKCLAKVVDNEKKVRVVDIQFTWDGNNVSKMVATVDDETTIVTMQYDTKNNPQRGFMSLFYWELDEVENGDMYYSKNNVSSMHFIYSDDDIEEMTFIYQYDNDNFPTMRTRQYADDNNMDVTYYEY